MRREDLKNLTRERLEEMICEWITRYHELNCEMINADRELKDKNNALKQRIKDLEDVRDELNERDEKIKKMQDRIDSDCVRINRLKFAIDTLVDMYAALRKQDGVN